MFNGFGAVYDKHSKVLILGSFPSVKSRARGFYYGNKQNRFWHTLERFFGEKIEDDMDFKIKFLLRHNIALYDAVEKSDLIGSADESLKKSNLLPADISFLLPPNTEVSRIICNGKTAYDILMKNFKNDIEVLCLPSTSSANPKYDYEAWEKALKNKK